MVIALTFLEACRVTALGPRGVGVVDLGIAVLILFFFAGSRDTLRKYYTRTEQLLRQPGERP